MSAESQSTVDMKVAVAFCVVLAVEVYPLWEGVREANNVEVPFMVPYQRFCSADFERLFDGTCPPLPNPTNSHRP
ncbi:hypothetical protein FOCC_FOCC013880 [Frankliniella occidentalis]|nr:hypothetical protein FOCC_FOCC013880 [Frankliniella occidentalis]